jgi:CheY-like chemotaxis protein
MSVKSELGHGTKFWCEFNFKHIKTYDNTSAMKEDGCQGSKWMDNMKPGKDNHSKEELEEAIRRFKEQSNILVAEDNKINQKVLLNMLKRLGYARVHLAENGELAVNYYMKGCNRPESSSGISSSSGSCGGGGGGEDDCYRESPKGVSADLNFPSTPPVDFIIMDCLMPVLSGLESTSKIREFEIDHRRSHVPIVALTANAQDSDKRDCFASGMDGFLTKPVNMKTLDAEILKHFGLVVSNAN